MIFCDFFFLVFVIFCWVIYDRLRETRNRLREPVRVCESLLRVSGSCESLLRAYEVLCCGSAQYIEYTQSRRKHLHLHFRNPSGQWWGQFSEMDKFSFLVNFRSIHRGLGTVQYSCVVGSIRRNGQIRDFCQHQGQVKT